MQKVILDGRNMTDKAATQEYLKEQFRFPEYYGRNLDALYDCLTEIEVETEIQIEHKKQIAEYLGDYVEALVDTIRDAVQENPNLQLTESE